MCRKTILLILFGLTLTAEAQTRIMVIGNSITLGQGSSWGTGWRSLLYDSLTTLGYGCVFVGPQGSDPIRGHFYAGEKIAAFYTGPGGTGTRDVAASMNTYQPHVVVVHLGTNDLSTADEIGPYSTDGGRTFDTATVGGRLAQFIAYLLQWKNGTRGHFLQQIFVAAIIPRIDSDVTDRRSLGFFNTLWYSLYPDVQSGRVSSIPPNSFRVVNLYENFNKATMLSPDGIHPNDSGYRRMAKVFYASLRGMAIFFDKVAGDGQRVRSGETLPQPITVRIRNGYGTPLSGQAVSFEILSGPATFVDSQNPVLTNAEGKAAKSVRLTGEGKALIGVTVGSTINRTLTFQAYAQDYTYVGGEVVYMRSGRPVPRVRIEWIESNCPIDTTDMVGQYASLRIPLGQAFSIRPVKPRNEDIGSQAVLSYDAGLVARHVVGVGTLDESARLAADVDGDGRITLVDAILIGRFAVGCEVPSGQRIGEWVFTPSEQVFANPPDTVRCAAFQARILGDVSASWMPLPSPKAASLASAAYTLQEDVVTLVLTLTGGGLLGADATLDYDPSLLHCAAIEADPPGFQVQTHAPRQGELRVGVYGSQEVERLTLRWILPFQGKVCGTELRIRGLFANDVSLPDLTLKVAEAIPQPKEPVLFPNTPNPFNAGTRIAFSLPERGSIELAIIALSGRVVRRFELGPLEAGFHEVFWDGRSDGGEILPSGMYFLRLGAGGWVGVRKMALAR